MPDQRRLSLRLTAALLSLQAGFAAEGVESGTVFSDINLQEKVRNLGTLQGTAEHLVEIAFLGEQGSSMEG